LFDGCVGGGGGLLGLQISSDPRNLHNTNVGVIILDSIKILYIVVGGEKFTHTQET